MCCDVEYKADVWISRKSYQNTFEKGKRKVPFRSIGIHTPQKKNNLGNEHLKNEGVNLIEV